MATGWKVTGEKRWGGVLWLRLYSERVGGCFSDVPYYDEFTTSGVFKAVARGHTDPRTYCMGCGVDEGALHERWCHAVKDEARQRPSNRRMVEELYGVKLPPPSQADGMRVRQQNHKVVFIRGVGGKTWEFSGCMNGKRVMAYNTGYYCPDCCQIVDAPPERVVAMHQPVSVNAKEWRFLACVKRTMHGASYGYGPARCPDCGLEVMEPPPPPLAASPAAPIEGNFRINATPEDRYLPGGNFRIEAHPENGYVPEHVRRELWQPSAVQRAPEFHLRPPRRELVVLVDDMSEPP